MNGAELRDEAAFASAADPECSDPWIVPVRWDTGPHSRRLFVFLGCRLRGRGQSPATAVVLFKPSVNVGAIGSSHSSVSGG
jgi:hypothetical protein